MSRMQRSSLTRGSVHSHLFHKGTQCLVSCRAYADTVLHSLAWSYVNNLEYTLHVQQLSPSGTPGGEAHHDQHRTSNRAFGLYAPLRHSVKVSMAMSFLFPFLFVWINVCRSQFTNS